jgi:hypothetical protein
MTPLLRTAVIAVAALAVGILVVPRGGPSAPATAPSPSASPSALASASAVAPLRTGRLEAGTYRALGFRPRLDVATGAGSLQLTLPAGWVRAYDAFSELVLEPVGAADAAMNGWWPDQLRVWARPAAITSSDGCHPAGDLAVGRSYEELLAYLLEHPGLQILSDTAATIGGYPAHIVDIAIASDWTRTCAEASGSGPIVPLFADAGTIDASGAIGAGWAWGAGGYVGLTQDPVRLVLIDLGQDDVVLVAVDSMLPDGQEALVEAAMPIVESMTFPD